VAVIESITGLLLEEPRRVGRELIAPLVGIWGARQGTCRVLYRIDDEAHEITVLDVSHRADTYGPGPGG